MCDKKVCKIEPIRGEIFENGIRYQLPCGVKYNHLNNGKKYEVHCDKLITDIVDVCYVVV